MTRAELA
jgi:hypothetical protein